MDVRNLLAQAVLVQVSGSGIPQRWLAVRRAASWPFSLASILSSSPPFRLVLDWIQIFPV